jgi:hypothetical protein
MTSLRHSSADTRATERTLDYQKSGNFISVTGLGLFTPAPLIALQFTRRQRMDTASRIALSSQLRQTLHDLEAGLSV